MSENIVRVVGVDNTGHGHVMRGTLKLFTHFQIVEGLSRERGVYKRVTLATHYGIKSDVDFNEQVAKFKFLNPTMKNVHISYEYVIREFG